MILHASLPCNFRGFSLTCLRCARAVAFQIHSAPLFEPWHRISGLRPLPTTPYTQHILEEIGIVKPNVPIAVPLCSTRFTPAYRIRWSMAKSTSLKHVFSFEYLVFLFVSVSLHIFFQMFARVKKRFHFTSGAAAQSIHRSSGFKHPKNFTASYSPAFFKSDNPSSLQQWRDTSRHPATPRIISSSAKNKWQGNVFLLLFVEDPVSVQMSKFDFKRAHPPPGGRLGRWFPAF